VPSSDDVHVIFGTSLDQVPELVPAPEVSHSTFGGVGSEADLEKEKTFVVSPATLATSYLNAGSVVSDGARTVPETVGVPPAAIVTSPTPSEPAVRDPNAYPYVRVARTPGEISGPAPTAQEPDVSHDASTSDPATGDPEGPTARTRTALVGSTRSRVPDSVNDTGADTSNTALSKPTTRTDNTASPAATDNEYRPAESVVVDDAPIATVARGTTRPADDRNVPDTRSPGFRATS
jgi:hypothetical protein